MRGWGDAGVDLLHRLAGLFGDFGGEAVEAAGVGSDGVEIAGRADEIEGAEGFPNFVIAGEEIGDGLAGGNCRAIVDEPAIERAGNLRTNVDLLCVVYMDKFDSADKIAGIDGFAGFDARAKSAGIGRVDGGGTEHVDDDVVAGGVLEADEGERGVAADVDVGIGEHGRERGVELRGLIILSHSPCGHGANLGMWIFRERDDLRVEGFHGGIAGDDAVGDLRERVLDVVRVGGGFQVVGELRVGERASEPGGAPEKKWHEDEEEREDEDDVRPAAGAGAGLVWRSCGI